MISSRKTSGSRGRRNRPGRGAFFIPADSLSDVAFLLLIFVLLISLAGNPQKIKIDYPETPRAYDTRRDKNCEIAITEGGEIYLNGLPGNLAQAKALIEDLSDRAPDTGIHVLADRRTPFQNVHGVLELLQGAAYPAVSFAVREEGQK